MANKKITEESLSKLYYALTGTAAPPREISESQQEARLKRQCLYEIGAAKEAELVEHLAHILGVSVSLSTSDADVERLYEAFSG